MKKLLLFTCLLLAVMAMSCTNKGEDGKDSTIAGPDTKKYIRKNAYSPDAAKDLEALDKALAIMRKADCSDPTSWYYQGAIHWIPDTITGQNKLCSSYQNVLQLKAGWDNCTHLGQGELIHFLVWHRMYIYYFEKIVRKLSGYQDFALPYWGYTDTTNITQNRTMPPIWRNTSNSLYTVERLDSLNNGDPISGKTVRRLDLTKLNQYRTYALYNENMNTAPHGAMHNYIGFGNDTTGKSQYSVIYQNTAYGMMADVSTAAFDPIFWAHHSNIDRLWQQWTNSPNGQDVMLEELKKVAWPYVFFNENGEKITYTIEEVVKIIYNLDYDYDDAIVKPKNAPKENLKMLAASVSKEDTLGNTSKPVKLVNPMTKLIIQRDPKQSLNWMQKNVKPKDVLVMSVKVSFTKAPKSDYEIYLNLPPKETPTPGNKYYVGSMTFFGADHKHSKSAAHGHKAGNKIYKTFNYEITNESAHTKALDKKTFDLSILKFNGSKAEDIQVESVSVVKQ
ncbi:tyrosinase family protein [Emticicia sp. 21SJ11W-3]|uniref:tyrosinase family protein n=1 Tax=Emticicia sp. 21SJ11W-3 TaxID=2916755 RepID=UPI00209F9270|nr:tyrosinase family protein [Emticicia sp. 21SJ11W-3]UTA66607.1 tyrosinase family protein [Emticicia sp. 21SJ11W-3]